jgi:hypothetical protein
VEKTACATTKQAKQNNAAAKSNVPLKPSCGSQKTATPTQRPAAKHNHLKNFIIVHTSKSPDSDAQQSYKPKTE